MGFYILSGITMVCALFQMYFCVKYKNKAFVVTGILALLCLVCVLATSCIYTSEIIVTSIMIIAEFNVIAIYVVRLKLVKRGEDILKCEDKVK